MHNNYYFLKQLSAKLQQQLIGFQLAECVSQNKDELLLGFAKGAEEFYIKASLNPEFCSLSFPDSFQRARRNVVELFKEIMDMQVTEVRQYLNERCFSLQLEKDYSLLFKMHGNRSNIVLCKGDEAVSLFKNKLAKDRGIRLSELDRPIEQTFEHFQQSGGKLKAIFPTFGGVVKDYLEQEGYEEKSLEEQWHLLEKVVGLLEKPVYYISRIKGIPTFSMLPFGEILSEQDDPIEAINEFFSQFAKTHYLEKEKQTVIRVLEKALNRAQNYIKKSERKLHEIEHSSRNEEVANIIMANLHQIPAGTTEVELLNFYTNEPIKIKLKRDLSPQKNAESYYRKAKNQKLEVENLKENLESKEHEVLQVEEHLEQLRAFDSLKELRKYVKEHKLMQEHSGQQVELPFRKFETGGYTILVGKDSKNSDLLSLKYAHKDDLWLHAKDVPGSHVIIRQQPGSNYPRNVIEKAAQLAAFYSKRKTDSLCPVQYTPKKYIRKPKGMPPGKVLVDKEEVILVEPMKWG
jgi:predicted ribosome quality control (RQC) complex YloA/Tae2 family protein